MIKAPLFIAEFEKRGGSWLALYTALHLGLCGLQFLSRTLTHHGRRLKTCPISDCQLSGKRLIEHILDTHKV